MKNLFFHFACSFLLTLIFAGQLPGQDNLFGGIFDKEAPEFQANIIPTADSGLVMLAFYFTHPKLSELEASVWIKDQGTNLFGGGSKKLVRGLRNMGNRQQDTIFLEGLADLHFYTIGVDYRNPGTLTRKFTSRVLKEGYNYRYVPRRTATRINNNDPSRNITTAPAPDFSREAERIYPPPQSSPPATASVPCYEPDLLVQVNPSGYCEDKNRPAVLIQCQNCRGANWEFSVEVRSESTYWRPLRSDGQRQSALGNSVRTEPLCVLPAGPQFLRVLAWGENCTTPAVRELPTAILIPGTQPEAPYQPAPPIVSKSAPTLPDTCLVSGWATLSGNTLRGTLELSADSPCGSMRPFVDVRYVHPGYRDITLSQVPVNPGIVTPFEIPLDEEDLSRGIHTVQVVAHVRTEAAPEGIPVASFWIKADNREAGMIAGRNDNYTPQNQETILLEGNSWASKSGDPILQDDAPEVSVRASDPNCTQIQDLRLVYFSTQSEEPLYISWLSPRCCQEEGCSYTIWAGRNPKQLRLLIEGSKRGAVVKELLHDLMPEDAYYEVVVHTSNGKRKAAYVVGEGPKYGFEEIIAYHDRLDPPASDTLVAVKGDLPAENNLAKGASFSFAANEPVTYQKAKLPIDKFRACRYQRETIVEGDQPVNPGDEVTIRYDYNEQGYRYTLYLQPQNSEAWVVAPGTKELQEKAEFLIEADPRHSGKYLILSYKPSIGWGCLSSPFNDPIEIKVVE